MRGVRLKVANFHLGGRGEEGETSFQGNPPKITVRGRRNIVLGSFVCDARHDEYICTTLRGAFQAAHTPYEPFH